MSQPSTLHKCQYCKGRRTILLAKSWFTSDGYTRAKCSICDGTGEHPGGDIHSPDRHGPFQTAAEANVAVWGGLKPSGSTQTAKA